MFDLEKCSLEGLHEAPKGTRGKAGAWLWSRIWEQKIFGGAPSPFPSTFSQLPAGGMTGTEPKMGKPGAE